MFDVLYYEDQSVDAADSIEQLVVESLHSEPLSAFLRSAHEAISVEVSNLSLHEQSWLEGNDWSGLARFSRTSRGRNAALSTVLSCTAQLGWTVLHRSRHAAVWKPDCRKVVAGNCTGALAAIAAVTAKSESDLLRIAPDIVLVALYLGTAVARRTLSLEATSGSWAVSVSQVSCETVSQALDDYHRHSSSPPHRRIYISAWSSSGMTLSGPPSALGQFLKSEAMQTARQLPLPIFGAFHASHLPALDGEEALNNSGLWDQTLTTDDLSSLVLHHKVEGSTTNLKELLVHTIEDILQSPVDFDLVVGAVKRRSCEQPIRLTTMGPARVGAWTRALKPINIDHFGAASAVPIDDVAKSDYSDAIAIVGMACRVPGAQNIDELWELLLQEKDMHRQVPPDRFDVSTHYDSTGKIPNTTVTQWGCFDDHVSEFDLPLFKMSPREALQTDPCQRLMLITSYEALEAAGYYDPGSPRPRVGTFYGQAGDDYRQVNSGQNVDTNYVTGGIRAFGAGRVGYYFGWEGPSMTIDTACSSSAVAIHQACSSLKLRESNLALAGGANLLTCSDMFAGLSRAGFVSATGPCKTFDENADGYCRADGAASVVLKRYNDAIRDKDHIHGTIRSIDTTHAGTAVSITHPDADSQARLFAGVLAKAGMTAQDIDHVEMHGTGTQAGDLAETSSVASLVKMSGGARPKDRPLTIASVKPNVGHSEAASGITSLIKALLMMRHKISPKHIGIKTRVNPKLPPLSDMGIQIPLAHMSYTPVSDRSRILVNNFNATGGATTMLVEEHQPQSPLDTDRRGYYPVVVSAASHKSLTNSLRNLQLHITSHPDIAIADLSYSLTARRLHHSFAISCAVNSIHELASELGLAQKRLEHSPPVKRGASKRVIFCFTGQALSYPGMAFSLFQTNRTFREHLLLSNDLCKNMGLPSFVEVIQAKSSADMSTFGTAKSQLALVALEIALAFLFSSWGIQPTTVLGHSLGEYSAYYVSGALSLADTLFLVGKRAELMETLCCKGDYSMAATSLAPDEVQSFLSLYPQCELACLNGPRQTVLSGPQDDIDSLVPDIKEKGGKAKKLTLDFAFHSAQMDALLPEYERLAEGVCFKTPQIALASTCLGRVVRPQDLNARYLIRQTRQAVRFQDTIESISNDNPDNKHFWIEIGPAPACSPFISLTLASADTMAALDSRKPNWKTISEVVARYYTLCGDLRWDEFHKEYLQSLQLVSTPSYPFDMTKHWIQYEGDWAITKNLGPSSAESKLESSTVQRLESEFGDHMEQKFVYASSLPTRTAIGSLFAFQVAEHTFTPSSIFTDMAITVAQDIWKRSARGDKLPAPRIADFDLVSAAMHQYQHSERVDMKIFATQILPNRNEIKISIMEASIPSSVPLATCSVVFHSADSVHRDADNTSFLYQSRMDLLELSYRNSFAFSNSDIQSRIGSVEDSAALRDIVELVLNPGMPEAVGRIVFSSSNGNFSHDPSSMDTLLHIPSAALSLRGTKSSFSGWQDMTVLRPIQPHRPYKAHVYFQNGKMTGKCQGELHLFNDYGQPVLLIRGLRYDVLTTFNTSQTFTAPLLSLSSLPTHSSTLSKQDIPASEDATHPSDDLQQHANFHSSLGAKPYTPPWTPMSMTMEKRDVNTTNDSACSSIPDAQESPATPASPRIDAEQIIQVLAGELGLDPETMDSDAAFEDLGVDSIMQMTLVAKMQDCVPNQRLPKHLLIQNNTASQLRLFLRTWLGSERDES